MVIAAFSSWHALHAEALRIINGGATLPAHAGFETYSVLTRLPEPTRASPARVSQFLRDAFADEWLTMADSSLAALLPEFALLGIRGGATYDALIGATVRAAGSSLVTCDRRALATYERLGVKVQVLEPA